MSPIQHICIEELSSTAFGESEYQSNGSMAWYNSFMFSRRWQSLFLEAEAWAGLRFLYPRLGLRVVLSSGSFQFQFVEADDEEEEREGLK